MAFVRSKRTGRTAPRLKNVKKWPHKQNIAQFCHNSTMTVPLSLHRSFRTKIGITHSIESETLF